tara:strand:+ start:1041 stop:2129 length:1089 start_codon:yes stop_codon:yes gene_type:complete
VTQLAWGDYLAYSVVDTAKTPLPENIDNIRAKHLVNLEWGEFVGAKSRVGVLEVDNRSTAGSFTIVTVGTAIDYSAAATQVPVNGIEAIVMDTMNRSGRFRLVERKVLGAVLGEQDLASSGRVAKPSGARTGNVLGAQYLVQVVVTDYESNVKSTKGGVGALLRRTRIPGVGGIGVKSGEGRVGLNFRLIDAETSEVMYSKQVESVIKESGLIFGGGALVGDLGLGGFFDSYSRTPIGQAIIAGVNKGVYELVKEIGTQSASGSVVKADGRQVWLNLGTQSVSVGDRLNILSKGEDLIDPDTGISLGSSDTTLGVVEVTQVQDQFSIARNVSLSTTPARGDKAISLESAPSIEFASSWESKR